jgi:hypothetical protein
MTWRCGKKIEIISWHLPKATEENHAKALNGIVGIDVEIRKGYLQNIIKKSDCSVQIARAIFTKMYSPLSICVN